MTIDSFRLAQSRRDTSEPPEFYHNDTQSDRLADEIRAEALAQIGRSNGLRANLLAEQIDAEAVALIADPEVFGRHCAAVLDREMRVLADEIVERAFDPLRTRSVGSVEVYVKRQLENCND